MKEFLTKNPSLLSASFKSGLLRKATDEDDPENVLKPRLPKPTLERGALKKQRVKSKDGGLEKPKRTLFQLRNGLTIQLIVPEAEEGFAWHSRLSNGAIQVNSSNSNFLEA